MTAYIRLSTGFSHLSFSLVEVSFYFIISQFSLFAQDSSLKLLCSHDFQVYIF